MILTAAMARLFLHPLVILFGCTLSSLSHADLIISEFLSSNSGDSLLDENNESSDWIELRNTGNSSVSLSGYHLTDDAADLIQWTFPDISISAGDYLIVFASEKNRAPTSGELHTNFKLSAGGEYLALIDPFGTIIDEFSPSYPAQEEDISYGRSPDKASTGFFGTPTPGATNIIPSEGRVKDTVFSISRGIYETTQTLTISSATLDATIRYTTDGSTPTESNGSIYADPIVINETTVVRAAAFKDGLFPTNVDTHSYLFPSDVRTQFANGNAPTGWPSSSVNGQVYDYGMDPDITNRFSATEMENALTAIPSAMITTDIENLTDSGIGIYSNPGSRGDAWERAANIEFIGNQNMEDFSARCGLRIRGGASRNTSNPKHSFRIFFRDDYGQAKLEAPLFEEEGAGEFKKFDFRTAQNYSWSKDGDGGANTFLREVLTRDLQAASGNPYTRSRYYHLYLNGVYWGLFMTQERAEANYGETYLGGNSDEYDVLKSGGSSQGYVTEATDGELNGDWEALWNLAAAQESNPTLARYYEMQGLDANGQRDSSKPVLLDADNLIDYMMLIGYAGAYDNSLSAFGGARASNNWYSMRNRADDDQGFLHFMHDGEHSMGAGGSRWNSNNDRINTTNGADRRGLFERSNPQFLHMDLADSTEEYRMRFADRARAALFNNGYLTIDQVTKKLNARKNIVDQVIIAESARWGDARDADPNDRENWESAVSSLENTLSTRASVFLGHLRAGNLYPDTDAPDFSPFTHFHSPGTPINVSGSGGTIYYTTDGSDPRLVGGAVSNTATTLAESSNGSFINRGDEWTYNDSGNDLGSSSIIAGTAGWSSSNWKHPNFNDSGWDSGAAILGFGQLDNGTTIITTSMGEDSIPGGGNPRTSYLRKEFIVSDLTTITTLSGEILADDGAIVYLNGHEVHRTNLANGTISSSTFAESAVGGTGEVTYNTFTIDPSFLVTGTNLVAVEIHQVNANSSDLGFDLSIQSTSGQTIPFNSAMTLNARVLDNGEWSALTSNYFSTGVAPELGDLIISEIHYHPTDPSTPAELAVSTSSSDYEFIELANVSDKTLELLGTSLTEQVITDHLEGVSFLFEKGHILQPGARVVIAGNLAAFQVRYPSVPSNVIAGQFNGSLGNSGEWLRLLSPDESQLASFRYNDVSPWPTEADGIGASLQLANLNDPNLALASSWMSSFGNGTPGAFEPAPFSGDPLADSDGNGRSDLIDYFTGSSELSTSPVVNLSNGNWSYRIIRDPNALGVTWDIQSSSDLKTDWSTSSSTLTSRMVLPSGQVEEIYDLGPISQQNQFVRLVVEGNF